MTTVTKHYAPASFHASFEALPQGNAGAPVLLSFHPQHGIIPVHAAAGLFTIPDVRVVGCTLPPESKYAFVLVEGDLHELSKYYLFPTSEAAFGSDDDDASDAGGDGGGGPSLPLPPARGRKVKSLYGMLGTKE